MPSRNYLLILLLFVAPGVLSAQQKNATNNDVLSFVDPTIGNVGRLLEPTRPTVQLPNQMIRVYPLRADYLDDQISGYPLIVVSHRQGGAFRIKPWNGPLTKESWSKRLTYDHDLEVNRPWYHTSSFIENGMKAEFVPGKKTGIFRFDFLNAANKNYLLLNNMNRGASSFRSISPNEIEATETYHGDINVYLYARTSEKAVTGFLEDGTIVRGNETKGNNFMAYLEFPEGKNKSIEFRYAISYVSPEQARLSYNKEFENADFNDFKASAGAAWRKVIGQITVDGGTLQQKRSFYTALYRCYERMVNISEDGKYYSGFDKQIHQSGKPFYVDDWAWDTYLAHHPLRMILNPAAETDMLNSYVAMYQQSGWMPTFPVLYGDHACMNGFHSSVVFLDAYRKGLRNIDFKTAYEGMYKNATQATMIPWRNGPKTPLDDVYLTKGYFPALRPGQPETNKTVDPFEKRQAVAVTLGGSYDDWAVGELAKELGLQSDYKALFNRRYNYKNLWNKEYGMFIPKDEEGAWIRIDPKFDGGPGGRDYYDENNGWTYMWQVQQDIDGLIGLMGGKTGFEQKLDQLFREPLGRSKCEWWNKFPDGTGMVGQFSMGNEPSFHIPYLFNYAGASWKTQKWIRFLLDTWFKDNIFGIPGDEDGGGMSAFVVFSSLGFYPVTPGLPVYTIGSPVFEKSTIRLPNGKSFTIIAKNSSPVNKYIQDATLNGKTLNRPWFTHTELTQGGTLSLSMGPLPNKNWGIE